MSDDEYHFYSNVIKYLQLKTATYILMCVCVCLYKVMRMLQTFWLHSTPLRLHFTHYVCASSAIIAIIPQINWIYNQESNYK